MSNNQQPIDAAIKRTHFLSKLQTHQPLLIRLGLGLGLLAAAGFYYQYHQSVKAGQASVMYQQMVAQVQKQDHASAQGIASNLTESFSQTPYAIFAHWYLAQQALGNEETDYATAITHLTAAIDSTDATPLKAESKLRLARVEHANDNSDKAIELLESLIGTPSYEQQAHWLLGEYYFADDNCQAALPHYQAIDNAADTPWLKTRILVCEHKQGAE